MARRDVGIITGNKGSGFAVDITFVAPDATTVTVPGLHSKHHLAVDTDGTRVSSKTANISVYEKALTDLGYPTRNAAGDVDMKKHKVTCKDSTGNDCTYLIDEVYPDETVGLITCSLVTFNNG